MENTIFKLIAKKVDKRGGSDTLYIIKGERNKMKKKLMTLVLAICLCLPMLFLATACGETNTVKLEIDTTNAKTEYVFGEAFSSEGLVVKKVNADGTKEEIQDYRVDSSAFSGKTGLCNIIVYITENNIHIENTYAVYIRPREEHATLSATAGRKYFIGQSFGSAMPVVTYTEEEQTRTLNATDYIVENFDNSTAGAKQVTIRYGQASTTLWVEVLSNENYKEYIKTLLVEKANSMQIENVMMTAHLKGTDLMQKSIFKNNFIYTDVSSRTQVIGGVWFDSTGNVYYHSDSASIKKTYSNFETAVEVLGAPTPTEQYSLLIDKLDSMTEYAFSIQNGKLNIIESDNGHVSITIVVDYTDMLVVGEDYSDTNIVYELNSNFVAPVIPTDVEWGDIVGATSRKYFIGQDFYSAMPTLNLSNGQKVELKEDILYVPNFDSSTAGTKTVEFKYTVFPVTMSVEVLDNDHYRDYIRSLLLEKVGTMNVDNLLGVTSGVEGSVVHTYNTYLTNDIVYNEYLGGRTWIMSNGMVYNYNNNGTGTRTQYASFAEAVNAENAYETPVQCYTSAVNQFLDAPCSYEYSVEDGVLKCASFVDGQPDGRVVNIDLANLLFIGTDDTTYSITIKFNQEFTVPSLPNITWTETEPAPQA